MSEFAVQPEPDGLNQRGLLEDQIRQCDTLISKLYRTIELFTLEGSSPDAQIIHEVAAKELVYYTNKRLELTEALSELIAGKMPSLINIQLAGDIDFKELSSTVSEVPEPESKLTEPRPESDLTEIDPALFNVSESLSLSYFLNSHDTNNQSENAPTTFTETELVEISNSSETVDATPTDTEPVEPRHSSESVDAAPIELNDSSESVDIVPTPADIEPIELSDSTVLSDIVPTDDVLVDTTISEPIDNTPEVSSEPEVVEPVPDGATSTSVLNEIAQLKRDVLKNTQQTKLITLTTQQVEANVELATKYYRVILVAFFVLIGFSGWQYVQWQKSQRALKELQNVIQRLSKTIDTLQHERSGVVTPKRSR